jgi:hypothetical protein
MSVTAKTRVLAGLVAALASACSYRALPPSGQQQCAPVGQKRCPDGYYCAADDTCWKNGQRPPEDGGFADDAALDGLGATSEGGPPPFEASPPPDVMVPRDTVGPDLPPPLPAPSSRALAGAATISVSATYRAVRTLGQAPGGNTVRSSATMRAVGGLVGATQR